MHNQSAQNTVEFSPSKTMEQKDIFSSHSIVGTHLAFQICWINVHDVHNTLGTNETNRLAASPMKETAAH